MAIPTKESLIGTITNEPRLSYTSRGDACFYARIAHDTWRYNKEDGTFTQEGSTFHDLVQYSKSAEHASKVFRQGDRFVAEGYTRTYTREVDGKPVEFEQFVAQRLGHDCARTTYVVDRAPRIRRTDPEQGPAAGNTADAPTESGSAGGRQPHASRQQQLPPVPEPAPATPSGPYGQAVVI